MADVFISYSQQTPEPTVAVAAALTERGFKPWYDVNLLPGQFFGAVIDDAIDRAQAVITIWSPPAITSQWVPAESARALSQKKLICVCTPDVDPKRLPTPFHTLHVPLWSDLDGIFQALVALGARPSGATGLTDMEALAANAALDWKLLKQHNAGHEELEAFLAEYGSLPMYRRMAEARLKMLGPSATISFSAPAPIIPAPPPARPEDVILRLDPGMHIGAITHLSVSADRQLVATGSHDKTIKLWTLPAEDGKEAKLLRTLRPPIGPGYEGRVSTIALDPAGHWLAVGGWMKAGTAGHSVVIFKVATGQMIRRLGPLPNVVGSLAASVNGDRLAVGLAGKNGVRAWETGDWTVAFEDSDYDGSVPGISFAADGRMATTSYDGNVRLYDATGRRIARAKTHGPFGIAFAPSGEQLAVGHVDAASVDLFDGCDLRHLGNADTTGLSDGALSSVTFLSDGRLAAAGRQQSGGRCPIFVWSESGRGTRTAWQGPKNSVLDLTPLGMEKPSNAALAFCSADPAFGVFRADGSTQLFQGPPTADLRGKKNEHFTVSADGQRLRFGLEARSGKPVLLNLATRTLSDEPLSQAAFRQANSSALEITDWENSTAPKLAGRALSLDQHETAFSVDVSPDAQSFVLGTAWSLRRFNASGQKLWQQPAPGVAWGVNHARDGKLILAAYGDGTIRWHRASDGKELLALFIHLPQGPGGPRDWILFTPEGYYEASSPAAEKLIGWHVNRGPDEAADFYPVDDFANAFRKPERIDAALDDL